MLSRTAVRGVCAGKTFVRGLVAARLQSTSVGSGAERALQLELEYTKWIDEIRAARQQVEANPPGLLTAVAKERAVKWEPTPEQVAEFDQVKELPIPAKNDPVMALVVNMIMRDGKKQLAEKILGQALYIVYLRLRTDPVVLFKRVVDEMAPLMVVKSFKTGFAKRINAPVPLPERSRRRMAILWVLEGARKRSAHSYAVNLGEEIIAAHLGKGNGFDQRAQLHKASIANRAYVRSR